MTLVWYINRLRSMNPAEVLHRLGERGRREVSRRRHQGWARYPARDLHPVWPALRARVAAAAPAQRAAIAASAEAFLAGRFAALGRDWPAGAAAAPYEQFWRLDPVTGGAWPDAGHYCFAIDFRHDGARGDVKYVWEANRLHFLPALAAHVVLTGDAKSLAAIEAVLASWHAANPPFGGVAWASGIEVAIRAISVLAVLDLVGAALSAATRQRIGQLLAASAFWLPRFPSLHSSANNHLMAELAGRYLIARALGENGAAAWAALLAELDKQILPDGAGAEQSPTYAAFSCELVLLCAEAARAAGTPLPPMAAARLDAFAGHIAWLGPEGRFGDDDEGRAIALAPDLDYPGSVASAIRGHLGRPGRVATADDSRALFFPPVAAAAPPPAGLHTFPHGGLTVWRGDINGRAVDLRFDHGPLGYLSIAAHGHADALALALTVDGRPVLVDPGTYLYGSGGAWRDWFRSTPAHNTLNLDGQSQSLMSGAFNWARKATATLVDTVPPPAWRLGAEHDGYRRDFGVVHRRTLWREGDAIVVEDRLLGGAGCEAEIVWQLAADIEVRIAGNRAHCRRGQGEELVIDFPGAAPTLARGDEPGGGWVSTAFGHKAAAPRLAWRGRVDAAGVRTRLVVPTR